MRYHDRIHDRMSQKTKTELRRTSRPTRHFHVLKSHVGWVVRVVLGVISAFQVRLQNRPLKIADIEGRRSQTGSPRRSDVLYRIIYTVLLERLLDKNAWSSMLLELKLISSSQPRILSSALVSWIFPVAYFTQ